MTPRWPPILGVTGFDFGEKPAISLTLSKKKELVKEEWETPITGGETPPTCPPAGAPTHVILHVKLTCNDVEVILEKECDFTMVDLDVGSCISDPTCAFDNAIGEIISNTCEGAEDSEFAVETSGDPSLVVIFNSGSWFLELAFQLSIATGCYSCLTPFVDAPFSQEVDVTSGVLGAHVVTTTVSGATLEWTITLS